MSITTLHGDCREVLPTLPANSVQCVITSPPYFGLRSYTDDPREIGKETTPAAYVAALVDVFRDVRRVLRDDGVLWLNLGDSYVNNPSTSNIPRAEQGNGSGAFNIYGEHQHAARKGVPNKAQPMIDDGLKKKDLIGIPWMVARALQEPYYTGRIAREIDRVWLAAMIDAEGSICGFTHERKDDGRIRTGVHVQITNSSTALLDKANTIWSASRSEHSRPGDGHLGLVDTWRWIAHGAGNKAQLMRELYPYLVVKQKQAIIAYNVFMLIVDAKRLMHTPQAQQVRDKRAWAMDALSRLNHGEHIDLPSWCVEPPSVYEPGWYLRSDIIWAKPNCMPESVTDRPTRAHEYLFLFAKNARYFYDADAIREPNITESNLRTKANEKHNSAVLSPIGKGEREWNNPAGRNRRTVWTISTQPYSGAHYATMPEALIEPCILAGSSAKACETCGAAWGRVVERESKEGADRQVDQAMVAGPMARPGKNGANHSQFVKSRMGDSSVSTVGFAPRCACAANTGSAASVVLDPFSGSGTVARVAMQHGRDAIGIELSQEYIEEHIDKRTNNVQTSMVGLF